MEKRDACDVEAQPSGDLPPIERQVIDALKAAGLNPSAELRFRLAEIGVVMARRDPQFDAEDDDFSYLVVEMDGDVLRDSDGQELDLGLPPRPWKPPSSDHNV